MALLLLADLSQNIHDYGPTSVAVVGLVIGGIINALVLWKAASVTTAVRDATVEDLVKWKEVHERESQQRDAQIGKLNEIAGSQSQMLALLVGDLQDRMRSLRVQSSKD